MEDRAASVALFRRCLASPCVLLKRIQQVGCGGGTKKRSHRRESVALPNRDGRRGRREEALGTFATKPIDEIPWHDSRRDRRPCEEEVLDQHAREVVVCRIGGACNQRG